MPDLDNLYPNDGQYFSPTEPKDQREAREAEENELFSALPLIKAMIGRLEERITFYGSVESVPDDVLVHPEEFMHVVAANKLVKQNLESEKDFLEDLVQEHVKTL